MISTLRQRNFALLWTAGLISLVGDWAFYAAMPIFVLDRTGSAVWSGLVWAAVVLPGIVIGAVAGVFVDRWDRRMIMLWGNVAQTIAASILLLAGDSRGIWVAMAVLLIQAFLYAMYSPAESALLPTLVDDARLSTANALNSLNDNIARVAGPVIGALLYAWLGIRGIALANTISFAGAALLVGMVTVAASTRPRASDEAGTSIPGMVWEPLLAGASTVWSTPRLRAIFAIIGLVALADGPLTAMLAPFIRETLDRSAADFGAFLSWRGVAGIVGGIVIARIAHRFRDERLLTACLLGLGVEIAAFAIIQDYLITIVLMMLAGPAIVGMSATIRTMLQRQTADAVRGRVFSLEVAFWGLVFLSSTVLGSAAAAFVSPATVVFASGALYLLAGAGAIVLLLPRAEDSAPRVPAPDETPAQIT
jgi:predicted MFS family arabinose efflux permease